MMAEPPTAMHAGKKTAKRSAPDVLDNGSPAAKRRDTAGANVCSDFSEGLFAGEVLAAHSSAYAKSEP